MPPRPIRIVRRSAQPRQRTDRFLGSAQRRKQAGRSMAKGPGRRGGGAKGDPAQRLLADNRFARHQYEILETLETGI